MSSTERAPEPTMEDILASIRRIITDDDVGKGTADNTAATAQTEESLEGEADSQIIDDIARVLSSGGDEPANEDEEIMDLTGELGGLELVEDEPEELLETAAAADALPEFVDPSEVAAEPLELDEVQPDVLQPDVLQPDEAEPVVLEVEETELTETVEVAEFEEPLEMEAVQEHGIEPELAPMAPPPIPEPVAEVVPEAPKLSASEEAATALERAIAALKAGQSPATAAAAIPATAPIPTFEAPASVDASPELSTKTEDPFVGEMPPPADIPMAVPMESPTPDSETHLDPDAESVLDTVETTSDPEPLDEEELVMVDTESEDAVVLEDAEPELAPEAETEVETGTETESGPFWAPQDYAMPAPAPAPVPVFTPAAAQAEVEAVAVGTNGVAPQGTPESRSLEDSIKEMLRPMLREWLDDNMPRIIREELDSDALRGGQD